MKKKIAYILVALLIAVAGIGLGVSAFNNANNNKPDTEVQGDNNDANVSDEDLMKKAVAYVKTIYKDVEKETAADFERIGTVPVGKAKFTVDWSVDVSEDIIKIVKQENGMVTIDINEEIGDETPYVLTATISDSKGNKESLTWDHVIPAKITGSYAEIVDMAYALKNGEKFPSPATLEGVIANIDTKWSDDYKNITVTIIIEGREDKPIMCYRLKGDGAKDLAVGDKIKVTGILKNYNGTIEFDAGCTLDSVVKGDGKAPEMPKEEGTMQEIVDRAYALGANQSLKGQVTLTGTVSKIKTAWTEKYDNADIEIVIDGRPNKPILCFRLEGDNVKNVKAGDLITVEGYITNYVGDKGYSTIEFKAGCKLIKWVKGGGNKNYIDNSKPVEKPEANIPSSTDEVKAGDRVVIWNTDEQMALTVKNSETASYKYVGSKVTLSDNKLIYKADACIYVVEKNGDYYRFKLETNGKYLSAYKNGSYVNLTYDGEYKDWAVTRVGNKYVLKLATCPASNYGPYFLEYYPGNNPGWTVYAEDEAEAQKDDLFLMGLYVIPKEVEAAKASDALLALKSDLEELDLSSVGEVTLPNSYKLGETTFNVTWTLQTDYTDNVKLEGQKLTLKASETSDVTYELVPVVTDSKDSKNTAKDTLAYTVSKVAVPTANDALAKLEITDPLKEQITINNTVKDYTFTVTWDVDVDSKYSNNVKIETTETGKQLVIEPSTETEITYKLVATVTNDNDVNDVETKSWEKTVPQLVEEKSPTKNVLVMSQENLNKTLYFNGKMDGYYLATTENVEEAVAIYTDETENGVRLYFMDGKVRKYIDVYAYNRVQLITDVNDAAVYEEYNGSYAIKYSDAYYFVGTTAGSTYKTLAATKVDGSNYIAQFKEVAATYKLSVYNETRKETLYFNGKVGSKDYYLASTTNSAAAVSIYIEEVTGGVQFYFMNESVKTYIDIYENNGYINARLTTEPIAVFSLDPEKNIYVAQVGELKYFLGTSGTYTTLTAEEIAEYDDYYAVTLEDTASIVADKNTVVETVAHKTIMSVYHGNLGCDLYLDGGVSGNYLTTTTNVENAIEIFKETTDGGCYLYFMDGTTKTYIDINSNKKACITTSTPNAIWSFDESYGIYVADVSGTDYCIGTSKDYEYNTVGAVKLSSYNYNFVANIENPTAYKLCLYQATNGNTIYFKGVTTANYDYRLDTTTTVAEAVDVYAEEVTGGVRFYFMNGTNKIYIDMYDSDDSESVYVKIRLTDATTATAVYTFDENANTYVVAFGNAKYYIGTNSNFTNLEAKKFSDGHSNYVANYVESEALLNDDEESDVE